jgi:predicted regulator of Ras-like GTPase activity (Roadblock/LC7/MglB family)
LSEVKINEKLQYELMTQLETLESTTDLEGTALITKLGHRIASSSRMGVDEDPHSATPATMINLGGMITQKSEMGELFEIVLTGEDGYTIITTRQDSDFMLLSHCKLASKLGYYFHKMRKAFEALTMLLQGVEIGAPSY